MIHPYPVGHVAEVARLRAEIDHWRDMFHLAKARLRMAEDGEATRTAKAVRVALDQAMLPHA